MSRVSGEVALRVFNCKGGLGSPQVYQFVNSLEQLNLPPKILREDTDYTVVFREPGSHCFQVKWYNQAGPIELCGSGAYGLAWLAFHQFDIASGVIKSSTMDLKFSRLSGPNHLVQLVLPENSSLVASLIEIEGMDTPLYFCSSNGVYLLDQSALPKDHLENWTVPIIYSLGLPDPHGFAVFNWISAEQTGYLRYFVPWHGRDEDHGTGSIQRVLAPLVKSKYGATEQKWVQLSKNRCEIRSSFAQGQVIVEGTCVLDDRL